MFFSRWRWNFSLHSFNEWIAEAIADNVSILPYRRLPAYTNLIGVLQFSFGAVGMHPLYNCDKCTPNRWLYSSHSGLEIPYIMSLKANISFNRSWYLRPRKGCFPCVSYTSSATYSTILAEVFFFIQRRMW